MIKSVATAAQSRINRDDRRTELHTIGQEADRDALQGSTDNAHETVPDYSIPTTMADLNSCDGREAARIVRGARHSVCLTTVEVVEPEVDPIP